MAITHDLKRGEVIDGDIRYVLMRPDVLMGVTHLAGHNADFLGALEASAFRNSQASFSAYGESGRFAARDFLKSSAAMAAMLGWGVWSTRVGADGAWMVEVLNSPFAAGHGPSNRPVCSPITGVLRAIALVGYGQETTVTETECVAQGAPCCRFRFRLPPGLDVE